MKKLKNLLVILVVLMSFQTNSQTYCSAGANYIEPITLVQFANINNSSPNTGGSGHQDFTNIIGNVAPGTSYIITVKGYTGGNYTNGITVFFDWNNNGYLEDAGEIFDIGTISNSTGLDSKSVSRAITIPSTACGNVRMRVFKMYNGYPYSCGAVQYGQSEDYTLKVAPAIKLETNPLLTNPVACNNATLRLGAGAYYDLTLNANTYYNFSWANNPATTGFTATILSGGAGATSSTFTTNQTNWYSGTTAPTLRVTSTRNACAWSTTSAVLTYRHSAPAATSVSGGGTFCATAMPTTLTASGGAQGTIYWQNTTSNGTSTATASSSQNVSSAGTYYFRSSNNGCWGTQGFTEIKLGDPKISIPFDTLVRCEKEYSNYEQLTAIDITGSVGTTYQWTSIPAGNTIINSTSLTPFVELVNSDYVLTATVNGCSYSDTVNVKILPLPCSPLPIELLSFNTSCDKNKTYFKWTTASEKNNDYFLLESSSDGENWMKEATVKGNGNSSVKKDYFLETDYKRGITYYRLKQFDFDGENEVVAQESALCSDYGGCFKLYPNPNKGIFEIEFYSDINRDNVDLTILNSQGKVVLKKLEEVKGGVTIKKLNLTSLNLPSGVYNINFLGFSERLVILND